MQLGLDSGSTLTRTDAFFKKNKVELNSIKASSSVPVVTIPVIIRISNQSSSTRYQPSSCAGHIQWLCDQQQPCLCNRFRSSKSSTPPFPHHLSVDLQAEGAERCEFTGIHSKSGLLFCALPFLHGGEGYLG